MHGSADPDSHQNIVSWIRNTGYIVIRQMKLHFEETKHTVTRGVLCECGRKFRDGTSGAYYLHRYGTYLLNACVHDYSVVDLEPDLFRSETSQQNALIFPNKKFP
jgi:hypothetical protein